MSTHSSPGVNEVERAVVVVPMTHEVGHLAARQAVANAPLTIPAYASGPAKIVPGGP